jgi:integrase
MKSLWTGIERHGHGYRASVSCGRGRPAVRQHFPVETPPAKMQEWRADTKASLRLTRKQRASKGTFEADARRYLRAVTALTTYKTRAKDIERWIAVFGTRRRDTISAADIREQRDVWITTPRGYRKADDGTLEPYFYASSTINHWLRALSNLWTVLDGKRAPNPVREVPECIEPDARPRAISAELIDQIIDTVSDRGRPKKGEKNTSVALTKLRLRVLATTGLTYAQLGRLTRDDVDLKAGTMFVRRREKGKGAKPRCLPLLPDAIEAFTALDAAKGWGRFSGASVRKSFVLAMKKLGVTGPRVYDLRHSIGTQIFRATRSLKAVRDLLSHQSERTAARYALGGVDEVLAAHVADVSSHSVIPRGKSLQPQAK